MQTKDTNTRITNVVMDMKTQLKKKRQRKINLIELN